MKTLSIKYSLLAIVLAISTPCSAAVLLNDTFADGSRAETNLPSESAVWVGSPDKLTLSTGSLAYTQSASSQKLWTYFKPDGFPVSLNVGDKLIATIEFSPKGAFYNSTSRNFRFGLFNDPTDNQVLQDVNSDGGGTGNPWTDSTGYAVQFSLSSAAASTIQVGKRIDQSNSSLLGSTGAYSWSSGTGGASNLVLDRTYTLTLTLEYQSADLMQVDFTFEDAFGFSTGGSLTDNGLGGDPVWTDFDQLFFRFSSTTGTADVIDIHRIQIDHVYPEIPTCQDVGYEYIHYANVSCRAEGGQYANQNRTNSEKLSVRASSNGVKSWIKFDISDYVIDPNYVKSATLRVTLQAGKGGAQTCDVSVVNDNYRTNIGWGETDITWTNAPGNNVNELGLLNESQTTFLHTISFTDGVVGQTFEIDVLESIRRDSDGILQFVLHNAPNLLDFATHDHPAGQEFWPRLRIIEGPKGADNPYPCPGQVVQDNWQQLRWTNPVDANAPADYTCTVYLGAFPQGSEPNRPQMEHVTLTLNANSVQINPVNFPTHGNLQNRTNYFWIVDCYNETTSTLIPGMAWSFYVNNNDAPVVSAGAEQVLWGLPQTVNLIGNVTDDGLPNPPGAYTVLWAQEDNGAPAVAFDPADNAATSVVITASGDYLFTLTADDGEMPGEDSVRVVVGATACEASHLFTGAPYAAGDFNKDCIVDLTDFAALIAANWLDCTDTQTNCLQN
jgi:hypothetical protein